MSCIDILTIAGFLLISIGLFPYSLQYHFIPYIMIATGSIGIVSLLYWHNRKSISSFFHRHKDDSDKTKDSDDDEDDGDSDINGNPINRSCVIVDEVQSTNDNEEDKANKKGSHNPSKLSLSNNTSIKSQNPYILHFFSCIMDWDNFVRRIRWLIYSKSPPNGNNTFIEYGNIHFELPLQSVLLRLYLLVFSIISIQEVAKQ